MMSVFRSRTAVALAGAAMLSLTATPAMARGWHRHHDRGLDTGDVLAGLLIIGGIAAVASAASKASKERDARDYRYPDRRDREQGYPQSRSPSDDDYRDWRARNDRETGYGEPRGQDDYRGTMDWRGAGSMDGAVNACVGEVERGSRRVDTVEGVSRDGSGWRVEGALRDGREYSCTADADGRVRRMTVDGQGVS